MKELHEKYFSNYNNSFDTTISFFNDHLIIFNNIQRFNNERDLYLFIEIYYACVNSFVEKNQYNNAINSILKVMPIIESAIDAFRIDRSGFDLYKWIKHREAAAYYHLKEYTLALKLFKQLSIYEPENDALKQWIEYCKVGRLSKFYSILWILLFIGVFTDIIGKKYIPFSIRISLLIVGILACLISGVLDLFLKRKRKRLKMNK